MGRRTDQLSLLMTGEVSDKARGSPQKQGVRCTCARGKGNGAAPLCMTVVNR